MTKRRLFLGAFSVASCTPIAATLDAGLHPIHDAGYDAGPADAGCRCYRADAG